MAKARTTTAKTTERSVAVAEKQARACRLRRDGRSYRDIARLVGYADPGAAHKAVHSAMAEITREAAESAKEFERERLDRLYMAALRVQAKAKACGELEAEIKAILAAAKLRESYRKLDGLDAPTRTQEVSPAALTDEALAKELQASLDSVRERMTK